MRISGASDRLKATRAAHSDNFVIAILVSYLLLVAIFSHWGYPLIIMLTVPIGITGTTISMGAPKMPSLSLGGVTVLKRPRPCLVVFKNCKDDGGFPEANPQPVA